MAKKRRREEDADANSGGCDQIPSLEDDLTFSDTSVALRIMRAQFPRIEKVSVQPFVLKSQLYSSVKDIAQVDRELEVVYSYPLEGKVDEDHVSLLINTSILTRQLTNPNMYWFAIPNIGPLLKGLSQGCLAPYAFGGQLSWSVFPLLEALSFLSDWPCAFHPDATNRECILEVRLR